MNWVHITGITTKMDSGYDIRKSTNLLCFLNLSSRISGHIFKDSGLISTKSISAPNCIAVFAVAANVMGLVQTKLDLFTSAKIYAKCNAEVALFYCQRLSSLTDLVPIASSNSSTFGPRDKTSEQRTTVTALISRSLMSCVE